MRRSPDIVMGALALICFLVLPFSGIHDYWLYTLTIGFYYAILAASWSLLVGYVGRISFAQAAMAGLGAYTSVLLVLSLELPIVVGLSAAFLVAGLVGLAIGWLSLRLHGPYLGLTTIAFAEILRIAVTAEHQWTAGSLGLRAPPLVEGSTRIVTYYLVLALLFGSVVAMWVFLRTRVGLFFQAIREDEDAAASLGVAVTAWKVLAFALSTGFAGLAGAAYAHVVQLIAPSMMSLQEMGFVLAMAVIGGFHNIIYAALGGILLQVMLEMLREIGEWRLAIFGLITILILRFAPNGLFGMLGETIRQRRVRR